MGKFSFGGAALSFVPAAQYLRMSNERQEYSLINQAETIQQYAQLHCLEIVETFCDAGRSGVRLKGRPGLIALLNDVMNGTARFRAVLVYDVSRWGRFQDIDEAAHYEFICKIANIPVHYCAESFSNENTPANSIVKALKRSMAAEYSREMGTRIFAGAKKLAELGFKQGGRAGYGLRRLMVSASGEPRKLLGSSEIKSVRTDRVILVPGPEEEVQCINEIYRLLVQENKTPYRITDELNRRGVKSPTGKWDNQLVVRILTDPKYAGFSVWNRTSRRLGSRRISIPRSNWILKAGAFTPLIHPDLFQRAQEVIAAQRNPYERDELLECLRKLLKEHGQLSCKVLKHSPGVPSWHTFRNHFGSLRRAFKLAGQQYEPTLPTPQQLSDAEKLRQHLIGDIKFLFSSEVSIFRRTTDSDECLQVDGNFAVSVVVCPAVRRNDRIEWFVDERHTQGTTITLLARLTNDGSGYRDLFITNRPRLRWLRRLRELQHCFELPNLSGFCVAVRNAVLH